MANSSEALGSEQAVLDGLVSHTLTEFIDDTVTKLGSYAIYQNEMLVTVSLPHLTSCGDYAFQSCTALVNAAFASLETMGAYMFQGCTNLINPSFPSLKTTAGSAFSRCSNLETVEFPSTVTELQSGMFQDCTKLKTVTASGATWLGSNLFSGCTALETFPSQNVTFVGGNCFGNCPIGVVELPACTTISSSIAPGTGPAGFDFTQKLTIPAASFSGNENLIHLVLRSNELCPLANVSAFASTPISIGCGYIYVPPDLVATYKAATNWSTFADQIVALSEYPKAPSGSISDSWSEIFAAEANGTYTSKYSIGDTKVVEIDGKDVLMEIVAFNADVLASDATKTAPITWISNGFIEKKALNATFNGDWVNSDMRAYLRETLYPKINATVRAGIKEVTKTYRCKSPTDETKTIADTVWIPSYREVGFTTASYTEASGAVYSGKFTDGNSRIKKSGGYGTGSSYDWWLRSAYNNYNFSGVSAYGTEYYTNPSIACGLVLGFCT